ncbi:MAG TPA: quinone-dependent dihydroorotate dehydrogenase [Rhizomicrobium sp.]|nr:quinone-dependent dihydroorotate dehydrogenase [Rhizomicrobium sp.]
MILDLAARLLAALPAETAHETTLGLTRTFAPLLPRAPSDDPRLEVKALGLSFPNPVGLAAGFDKDARVSDTMLKLGFGFVECGTVTPRPQTGNPRPRLFRLREDGAVINRMGFNNHGMEEAARHLGGRRGRGIVGINIGANKDSTDRIADYRQGFARLALLADYVTVNVSSPNTPGLRGLQNKEELSRLLATLTQTRISLPLARSAGGGGGRNSACDARAGGGYPILLKIAPDLDRHALDDIAQTVVAARIEGVIVSNTTVARPSLKGRHAGESGGLSGTPLFQPSTEILRQMRARLPADIVLIGVGGISCGRDAYEKILAGASLVQLYTAVVYRGPGLVGRIKRELLALLARDGFSSLRAAIGARP